MVDKDINIAVCYHKDSLLIENDCLTPIQVGKDCSDIDLPMIGDNLGNNISYKNFHYAELTATYWLWKNSNAKIKGLLHYRRLLDILNKNNVKDELYTCQYSDIKNVDEFLNELGFNEKELEKILTNNSIITQKLGDLSLWSNYSVKKHYEKMHTGSHIKLTTKVISKYYPQYLKQWEKMLNGTVSYWNNMVIMRGKDFDKYCEWLFDILFKVEQNLNLYSAELAPNTKKARWAGFLAERLTGLYIMYQKCLEKNICECPIVVLENEGEKWNSVNTYDNKNIIQKEKSLVPYRDNLPIISVCVAVYNTAPYLEKCLDSIINSTLDNIEIICVNDGSTDNSLQILEEYAQRDNRIKIISKENQGSGSARNVSKDNAIGKYIFFMDSDDFMDPNFLENMVKNAEKYNSDIVISNHRGVDETAVHKLYSSTLMHTLHNKTPLNIENCPDLMLVPCHVWDKIFNTELVKNIDFPLRGNGEDIWFWYNVLSKAKKISIHRPVEYNYRINTNSVQTVPKNIMNVFPILEKTYEFIEREHTEIKSYFDLFTYTLIRHMVGRGKIALYENREFNNEFYRNILNFVSKIEITDEIIERLEWYNLKLKHLIKLKKCKTIKQLNKFFRTQDCNSSIYFILKNYAKCWIKSKKKKRKYLKRIIYRAKTLPENIPAHLLWIDFKIDKKFLIKNHKEGMHV